MSYEKKVLFFHFPIHHWFNNTVFHRQNEKAEIKKDNKHYFSHTQNYTHINISPTQKNIKQVYATISVKWDLNDIVLYKILFCVSGDTTLFLEKPYLEFQMQRTDFSVGSEDRFYKRRKNNSWVIPTWGLQAGDSLFLYLVKLFQNRNGAIDIGDGGWGRCYLTCINKKKHSSVCRLKAGWLEDGLICHNRHYLAVTWYTWHYLRPIEIINFCVPTVRFIYITLFGILIFKL